MVITRKLLKILTRGKKLNMLHTKIYILGQVPKLFKMALTRKLWQISTSKQGLSISTIKNLWQGPSSFAIGYISKTIEDIEVKLSVMGSLSPESFSDKNFLHDIWQENTFKALFRSFEAIWDPKFD